ncbi:MAG: hypothetical protein V9G20_01850 [Candidatus Promineifilaceae bacterium]
MPGSSGFRGVRATLVVAPHWAGTRPARTSGVNPLNSRRTRSSLPWQGRRQCLKRRNGLIDAKPDALIELLPLDYVVSQKDQH